MENNTMLVKNRGVKIFTGFLFIFLMLAFVFVLDSSKVHADEGLHFEKSKYTLYEGNESKLNLLFNDLAFFQDSDEFIYDWGAYFSSSDPGVVYIDRTGYVVCRSAGTAVITAEYGGYRAECTVKSKKSKLKISKSDVELYSNQEITVKLSGLKSIKSYSYEIYPLDPSVYYMYTEQPKVVSDGNGVFKVRAGIRGEYIVRLIATKKNGKSYSKSLVLSTVECGPEDVDIYVGIGCSNQINMVDSEIISAEVLRYYRGNYGYQESDLSDSPILYLGDGWFSAKDDAWSSYAVFKVSYRTGDGTELDTEVTVSAYYPKYIPFDDYLWVGNSYRPQFEEEMYNSKIVCTSSDTSVADINEDGLIVPMKVGKAVVSGSIDGMAFSEEIEVIDIQTKGKDLLTWVGESYSFKVSGIPGGMKVTYSSTNDDVATISKKGKMKAVGKGFAYIIVTIGDQEMCYTVNVGSEIPVKACLAAEKVVGKATYSQSKRMEEGYYDCSSLAWRSYAEAGLKIKNEDYAPTAADLAAYLKEQGCTISYETLPVEEMLPGDLIFTSSGYDNGRFLKIDHVALYYGTTGMGDYGFGNDYYEDAYGIGTIVHAGSGGGGVYFGSYPGYSNIVMIARIKDKE